jgi:hypothetical protein
METEPVCETSFDLNHMKHLAAQEVLLNLIATKFQEIRLIIMFVLQILLLEDRRVLPAA